MSSIEDGNIIRPIKSTCVSTYMTGPVFFFLFCFLFVFVLFCFLC